MPYSYEEEMCLLQPRAHMALVLVGHGPNARLLSQVPGCSPLAPLQACQRLSHMLQVQPCAAWPVIEGSSACLQFAEALQANVWSAFNVLKGSVKAMMKSKKGGSVVLMSSSGVCLLQWQHLLTTVC